MYWIDLEDDAKPTWHMWHRLNPAMKEEVKAEVLESLDAGILYQLQTISG